MRPLFTGSRWRITAWQARFSCIALLAVCLMIGAFLAPSIANAQAAPTSTHQIQLAGLTMIDQQHGWAFDESHTHIYVTHQGPEHWRDVTPSQFKATNMFVTTSFFLDAWHGYIGALQDQTQILLSTQDSGQTWQTTSFTLSTPGGPYYFYQINFLDSQHGWLAFSAQGSHPGSSVIALLRTSNGGKTWETLLNTVDNPASLARPYGQSIHFTFANLQQGWATGIWLSGEVYLASTQDGGKTWNKDSIAPIKGADSIYFTQSYGPFWQNSRTGTLFVKYDTSSGNGMPHLTTYQTQDGGKTWLLGPSSPSTWYTEFTSFSFPNAREGFSFGFDGQGQFVLHHTSTGGRTWDLIHPNGLLKPDVDNQVLGGLTFLTPLTGWVWIKDSQNNWNLFQTDNGGHNWHALHPVAD
ncbi:WD40/YVTN/BNR-like repeat-containing protein [Ktedonobacter racemifer]|uniref:Uncharacterized protein n=1 Tax=Ktedonobacter racemifer DSM 44963 TaxID=485913 RepID=D6U6S7_KTERA|nr:YCF48-related protein [Ktedonobacter racemifer]EFH80688.1 hypothetical protein Krac_1304 [Ktedonobacter racemifer DSM 44963]